MIIRKSSRISNFMDTMYKNIHIHCDIIIIKHEYNARQQWLQRDTE